MMLTNTDKLLPTSRPVALPDVIVVNATPSCPPLAPCSSAQCTPTCVCVWYAPR